MDDITLTNPLVNSGTAVSLGGASFTYSWKNNNKKPNLPLNTAPVEIQTQGYQTPIIKVGGVIDIDNLVANDMTEKLLKDFAEVKYDGTSSTRTTLTIPLGTTPTYLTAYDSSTTSITVVVDDFSIKGSAGDSDYVHFLAYDLTMSETV